MSDVEDGRRVVLCTPTYTKPHPAFLAAVEASAPALDAAGIDHQRLFEVGNPYISNARATMLRKAMDAQADMVVFIDHDMSWPPEALVTLIETPGDVVAGTYRFKKADEEYMGSWHRDASGRPIGEHAGDTETLVLSAERVPAGFLKVTKHAVNRFMRAYPELSYGPAYAPSTDLFNHGAHEGIFWGEDYAFSRRWTGCGGDLWLIPDLDLTHHSANEAFVGNLHQYLMRQPGGANDPARAAPVQTAA